MASRTCYICGCPEEAMDTGPNATRVRCPTLLGQPCCYTAPAERGPSGWPFLRPPSLSVHSGAPSLGYSAQSTGLEALMGEPPTAPPEHGNYASFSYDGVHWFEDDDPFAPDSGSDDEHPHEPTTTGRVGPAGTGGQGSANTGAQNPAAAGTSNPTSAPTAGQGGRGIPMEVLTVAQEGQEGILLRPCIDCGRWTGCFCDYCYAADRFPDEEWLPRQHTPICSVCDGRHGRCHRCRGLIWATPPPWGPRGMGGNLGRR